MIRQNTNIPALWNSQRVELVTGIALLIPLIVMVIERGNSIILPLGLAGTIVVFWQFVFAWQKRIIGWDGVITAVLFILFLPQTVPLWQQGLAVSFGMVMGDLIFGERGRGFLNPVVVGLAFLLFSFPATTVETSSLPIAMATAISGTLLLATGLLSWRIVVGFLAVVIALSLELPTTIEWKTVLASCLLPGLVFLIGDPVAAASTNAGRWIYGGLAGLLVILLGASGTGTGSLSSIVFAALLASIFAPLIDQIIIWVNVRQRARRQI